jgi:hypothetical protein
VLVFIWIREESEITSELKEKSVTINANAEMTPVHICFPAGFERTSSIK